MSNRDVMQAAVDALEQCQQWLPSLAASKHSKIDAALSMLRAALEEAPGEWHAPGCGEVHNADHTLMIECMRDNPNAYDGDEPVECEPDFLADDDLARRVAAALNAADSLAVQNEGGKP